LGFGGFEEDVEVDDEVLPAMADDDYSAQLSWQSQSKDNLKCVYEVIITVWWSFNLCSP
jgi:transcription initiation factor TFIID subunit 11